MKMDLNKGVYIWMLVASLSWTLSSIHCKPIEQSGVGLKEILKSCTVDNKMPALQVDANQTERVVMTPPCQNGKTPSVEVPPEKLPVTKPAKQAIVTDDHSDEVHGKESSVPLRQMPVKEDLSGGKTGLRSDELHRYDFEEEEIVDSLEPHAPYPEMDGGKGGTTAVPGPQETDQEIAENNRNEDFNIPNEKKSELFIASGIFPFIAMGVLSVLFITMMIAALYFARHSSDVQHSEISLKRNGIDVPRRAIGGGAVFNAVSFRNAQDAVIGDFAINMFAVRQDEREEAKRELSESMETTTVASPAKTIPKIVPEPPVQEAERTHSTLLTRDLPDVVSSPSSRRDTMSDNRHSTGSSLYMELMNMCRNTQLLEELVLRRKNIRMQDATKVDQDHSFTDLPDTQCKLGGKLVVRRQTSLDSARYHDSIPLPCTYERHYLKLYDGDDDDSSFLGASANTTMDNVLFSSDDGCASNFSSLTRKGSSKRNSRLDDESRLLLPVQEFFNESQVDSSDADGDEVLYETIDEMGYRRRTASSRVIRSLMAARESIGQHREAVVVENAWDNASKKYDKIDRSAKAYKKPVSNDQDYNTLVV